MKKIIFILVLIFVAKGVLKGQEISPAQSEVCYGKHVTLKLLDFFQTDEVEWFYSYNKTGNYTPLAAEKFVLDLNTSLYEKKDIFIKAKINGNFETQPATITYIPDIEFSFDIPKIICNNQLATFNLISNQELSYTWYLDGQETTVSVNDKMDYFPTDLGNHYLRVVAENESGCSSEKKVQFNVSEQYVPQIEIKDIACSKGSTLIKLIGDISSISVDTLICYDQNGEQFLNFEKININDNLIEDKWGQVDEDTPIICSIQYKTESGCYYELDSEILLLEDKAPEEGVVFRKSPQSRVFIYDDKELNTSKDLIYKWGFTIDGVEQTLDLPNREYALYDENIVDILSNGAVWVDVAFVNNDFCSTKNVYSGLLDNEYQTISAVSIFPNPSEGLINIELEQQIDEIKIGIYNLQGDLLKMSKCESHSGVVSLNLNWLPNGTYNIRLWFEKTSLYSETIIINK